MRHRGVSHSAKRAADCGVATLEWRSGSRREVRHDHCDRHVRDRRAGQGDRGPCQPATSRQRIPGTHRRHGEPNLLLREAGEQREDGKRNDAILVEVPEGAEQERCGECHRMEVVHDEPLRGGVEEVTDAKGQARPLGRKVLPRKQEDGHSAGRDRDCLERQEERRIGPDPPEGCEGCDERVEVRAEPRDLATLQVCDLEEPTVRCRPDRLGEVAEVEAATPERQVPDLGERGEAAGERRYRGGEENAWADHGAATSSSNRAFHV